MFGKYWRSISLVCLMVMTLASSAARGDLLEMKELNLAIEQGNYAKALPTLRFYAEKMDDAYAQNNLGSWYYKGKGVKQDYAEAARWFRKAADQGNAIAQSNFASQYEEGKGVKQDYAEAARWYRKAADQGKAIAQSNLASQYEEGKGVKQDYAEAARWYRKAADQGNAIAQSNLADLYSEGKGVRQDDAEALKWYRKAADQGEFYSQIALGDMYNLGRGVRKDYDAAKKWFQLAEANPSADEDNKETANERIRELHDFKYKDIRHVRVLAEKGDWEAQLGMAEKYRIGFSGLKINLEESEKWLLKGANQGVVEAQLLLGKAYLSVYGDFNSLKNIEKSIFWLRKAAAQGSAEAAEELCSAYRESGETNTKHMSEAVTCFRVHIARGSSMSAMTLAEIYLYDYKNPSETAKWLDKAAEMGNIVAQEIVADCYESVPPSVELHFCLGKKLDYSEAANWYRKAADQGSELAQYKLGDLYIQGKGVLQDDAMAMRWYRKKLDENIDKEWKGYIALTDKRKSEYKSTRGINTDNTDEELNQYIRDEVYVDEDLSLRLGFMYALGRGVKKDHAEALAWWKRFEKGNYGTRSPEDKHTQVLSVIKVFGQASIATLTLPRSSMPVSIARALDSAPRDQSPPTLIFAAGNRYAIAQGELQLNGRATDAEGIAEVTVNGQHTAFAQDGSFSLKRFFPLGETVLEFKATDIHGNTASQKIVVVRQAASTQMMANEPELIPPQAKARKNADAVALIIGVEDYRNAPKAKWAAQDASMFYDYAQSTLGIPAGNIKLLTGEQANRTAMITALKTWLAPMVTPGKSQVYVYFAGHGLAASEGDKAYLIPQDGDPGLLEDTALDRQRLFDEIAKVKPLSATIFLDTCYSGGARGGESTLVANARPVLIKSKSASLPPGFMQFSAASNDQLAHSHPSQQHGLFSYYLMRGLGGEADANKDNKLTAGELQDYVQEKVKRMALTQGRPQEPELIGDRNKVIAVWPK